MTDSKLAVELFDVIYKHKDKISVAAVVGVLEMLKHDMIVNEFKETLEVMANEARENI